MAALFAYVLMSGHCRAEPGSVVAADFQATTKSKLVGFVVEDVFIYDSPVKMKVTDQVLLSSSSSSDEVIITQTLKNQIHSSCKDISF
jgi:hypothetical protein